MQHSTAAAVMFVVMGGVSVAYRERVVRDIVTLNERFLRRRLGPAEVGSIRTMTIIGGITFVVAGIVMLVHAWSA